MTIIVDQQMYEITIVGGDCHDSILLIFLSSKGLWLHHIFFLERAMVALKRAPSCSFMSHHHHSLKKEYMYVVTANLFSRIFPMETFKDYTLYHFSSLSPVLQVLFFP